MPHSITHGDACFAYFNKIWGIPRRFLGIPLSKTEFRAAYLLPNALMASLLPVFEPGLVRAEINNAGAFAPCPLAHPPPRVAARGAW
jgi:hypothetical protein